jgi:hypothetical protein
MKIIKSYQQFNESIIGSGLDSHEEKSVKNLVDLNIKSLNSEELNSVFNELEKISQKINCKVDDLTNVDFVKKNLLSIAYNYFLTESLFADMKDKILKFFLNFFQIGGLMYGLIKIVISAVESSFWGVLVGSISIVIATLASQYLYSKLKS